MFIVYVKKVIVFISWLLLSTCAFSQTTSRLTLMGDGETIYFNFNSFEKYRHGISLTTVAGVSFVDIGDPTLKWELDVKAITATIVGDYGNALPLSTIEIESAGCSVGETCNTIILSNADNVHLVQNGEQTPLVDKILTLTYNIGTNTPLLGESPDYYFVDILYTLQPQ
jgi:hypothetical protein